MTQPSNRIIALLYDDITKPMNRLHLLKIVSATLFLCIPAPADEMVMNNVAVAKAADTKHVATAESLSECDDMNAGERPG